MTINDGVSPSPKGGPAAGAAPASRLLVYQKLYTFFIMNFLKSFDNSMPVHSWTVSVAQWLRL